MSHTSCTQHEQWLRCFLALNLINELTPQHGFRHSPILWIAWIRPLVIVVTLAAIPARISRRILALNHTRQNGDTQNKYRRPFAIAEITFSLLQHTFRFENLFSLVTAQVIIVDCDRCRMVSRILDLFAMMSHFTVASSFIHVLLAYLIIMIFFVVDFFCLNRRLSSQAQTSIRRFLADKHFRVTQHRPYFQFHSLLKCWQRLSISDKQKAFTSIV